MMMHSNNNLVILGLMVVLMLGCAEGRLRVRRVHESPPITAPDHDSIDGFQPPAGGDGMDMDHYGGGGGDGPFGGGGDDDDDGMDMDSGEGMDMDMYGGDGMDGGMHYGSMCEFESLDDEIGCYVPDETGDYDKGEYVMQPASQGCPAHCDATSQIECSEPSYPGQRCPQTGALLECPMPAYNYCIPSDETCPPPPLHCSGPTPHLCYDYGDNGDMHEVCSADETCMDVNGGEQLIECENQIDFCNSVWGWVPASEGCKPWEENQADCGEGKEATCMATTCDKEGYMEKVCYDPDQGPPMGPLCCAEQGMMECVGEPEYDPMDPTDPGSAGDPYCAYECEQHINDFEAIDVAEPGDVPDIQPGDIVGCTVVAHFHEGGDADDTKSESVEPCLVTGGSVGDDGELNFDCEFAAGDEGAPISQTIPADWCCEPGEEGACAEIPMENLLTGNCPAMQWFADASHDGPMSLVRMRAKGAGHHRHHRAVAAKPKKQHQHQHRRPQQQQHAHALLHQRQQHQRQRAGRKNLHQQHQQHRRRQLRQQHRQHQQQRRGKHGNQKKGSLLQKRSHGGRRVVGHPHGHPQFIHHHVATKTAATKGHKGHQHQRSRGAQKLRRMVNRLIRRRRMMTKAAIAHGRFRKGQHRQQQQNKK